jgi:hypothetical protein
MHIITMLSLGHTVTILVTTWNIGVILVYPWWHPNSIVVVQHNSWKILEHRHTLSTVVDMFGKSWGIIEVFLIILEAIVNNRRGIVKAQSHRPDCCLEWPRLAPTQFVHGLSGILQKESASLTTLSRHCQVYCSTAGRCRSRFSTNCHDFGTTYPDTTTVS